MEPAEEVEDGRSGESTDGCTETQTVVRKLQNMGPLNVSAFLGFVSLKCDHAKITVAMK